MTGVEAILSGDFFDFFKIIEISKFEGPYPLIQRYRWPQITGTNPFYKKFPYKNKGCYTLGETSVPVFCGRR